MRRLHLIATALFALLGLTGCREQTLYSGLQQREANEMLVMLEQAGYSARSTSDGRGNTYTVSVGQGQAAGAARVLARAGLPREKQLALTEVLPRDSYMISPVEDRARLAYGISQELTNTLMRISGITQARVHVALAEKNVLGQVTTPPSASVLVRLNPDVLGGNFSEAIRSLVANSVAGLSYDRVAVTMIPDVPGGTAAADASASSVATAVLSNGSGFSGLGSMAAPLLLLLLFAAGAAGFMWARK